MRLKGFQLILASFSVLFLFSCLTINIYFPEAAVKKTADEIVGEITKSDKEAKEEKIKPKTKTTKKQKPKEDKPELTLDHFTKT